MEIRQLLSQELVRGKIECTFHYELLEGTGSTINKNVVKGYMDQLYGFMKEYQISNAEVFSTIMRLPDTISTEKATLEEEEWDIALKGVKQAIEELDEFRKQEGKALETDISKNIEAIREKLNSIGPYEKERIEKIRERIRANLNDLELEEGVDSNRFEQEIIFYLEKLDINEEKSRLTNHLDYFLEVLQKGSPAGKKLGFISQEIGREINTLGSKANNAEIQKLVMEMKDELEKIKEQILNAL